MFKCDKCGYCCKTVSTNEIYRELDRGDGICKFFDDKNNICSIYDNRPVLCSIDKSYELYFNNVMSKEEFYNLNYEACNKLKEQFRNK